MFAKYYLINVEVLRSRTDSPLAAHQFLRGLQAAGMPFLLVADASGRTRGQLCGKLQDQGFRGISEQQIYTSAMAAVDYACRVAPAKKNARFLGGAGLGAALETGGFMLQGGTPDWLFLGLDRNAAYSDYTNALRILDQGAQLITADNAPVLSGRQGRCVGNGAVADLLECASGKPAVRVSFPNPEIVQDALRYAGVMPQDAILIGASLPEDITAAAAAGVDTVLVSNAEDTLADVQRLQVHPTYIVDSLAGLLK
jgi:ribonucleotide monophosphatase NagD (HAD superfamily)